MYIFHEAPDLLNFILPYFYVLYYEKSVFEFVRSMDMGLSFHNVCFGVCISHFLEGNTKIDRNNGQYVYLMERTQGILQ